MREILNNNIRVTLKLPVSFDVPLQPAFNSESLVDWLERHL
jgi:hypothetical protein